MVPLSKPKRLQEIILPPYINRGEQRIRREKKKNILSVPFLDVELRYWYRVGYRQRGIHSRPYTYVVITLESLLVLLAFLLLSLILRIINTSPDAPINMLIAQRNYFLTVQNS
ncbi:hypothetical protein LOAG_14433, partial [Loa loa]|uniref:Uncharacterized protein n=1 Tax=Loa loa TaxID=7209 RepID=A0A1I7W254_LOALO